jgi:hypothetical protein
MRLNRWMIAVSMLVLSASASAQYNELGKGARRIAVAVWAGHELKLQQMGMLVFGNQYGKVLAQSDALAAAIYEAIEVQIKAEGRAEVRRLVVDVSQLPRLSARSFEGSKSFFGASLRELAADVDKARANCDCDALLIVAETSREIPGSNQYVRGLTWFNGSNLASALPRVSAPMTLFLVDPATGKVSDVYGAGADMVGTAARWSGKAEEVTSLEEAAWTELAQGVRAVLATTLQYPLYLLALRPSCTRYFYEQFQTPQQRDPSHANFVPMPPVPEGTDPQRCSVGRAVTAR